MEPARDAWTRNLLVLHSGGPPGPHAFHIHSVGKAEPPSFKSSGGHFNPYGKSHGLKNPHGRHAGDLINLQVGPEGVGTVVVIASLVTLGEGENSLFDEDGSAIVSRLEHRQFARLAALLDYPEWAEDPAYATNAARVAHRQPLVEKIAECLAKRSRDAWLTAFEAHGIPAGPIHSVAEALEDAQVRHRGLVRTLERAGQDVPQVANPLRFDGVSCTSDVAPPALGADSDAVLTEMGLSADDIAKLRDLGVVR